MYEDNIDKIIIIKNIENINLIYIKELKYIIEKYSIYCKFIILTTKPILELTSLCACVNIPILQKNQLLKN